MNFNMKKDFQNVEFNTQAGSIRICNVFEFIQDVRKHFLASEVAITYSSQAVLEMRNQTRLQMLENSGPVISKTTHILKQNPNYILADLKKSLTKSERRSKYVPLDQLLNEFSIKSLMLHGRPSHFFPVGQNRYALICVDDVSLHVNKDYNQTLICHGDPKRNFMLYVPNLKVSTPW